jgi:hypothetical protein
MALSLLTIPIPKRFPPVVAYPGGGMLYVRRSIYPWSSSYIVHLAGKYRTL